MRTKPNNHKKQIKRQPQAAKAAEPLPYKKSNTPNMLGRLSGISIPYKKVFFAMCAVIFILLALALPSQGVIGDEDFDGSNGYYVLQYYAKGDTSFANYEKLGIKTLSGIANIYSHLRYYGVGFEILAPIIEKCFKVPYKYHFEIRHTLSMLFGFLTMLFCGLIARQLRNWQTACLALLIIFLTPIIFGWTFSAYKDIPMAAGFAAGLWIFIKIYKTLSAPLHGKPKLWQRIRWQHALIAAICIGWSLSVRILGLLLPFYFAVGLLLLFILNKTFRASIVKHGIFTLQFAGVVAAICMVGIFLGLCLYPNFFYAGPISHIKSALGMASHFQGRITMLWDRQIIDSLHLPPYYLIKSYLYTIPPWALAGGALFIVNLRRIRRGYPAAIVLLTLFTIVFPAIYIILAKSPAYNGWRHTCFIYSSFAAISAIGIYETAQWFKQNRVWKLALAAILALCMLPTARWLAANYKYASSYYNAFAGNPYGKYDLDPSEVAVVNLAKWLVENKLTDTTKRYKVSVKNMNGAVWAHAKDIKHVQMIWNGMRGYAGMDCDYAILSLQFLPHKIIRDFFPPKGTIRVERIDGMPIGCIVQKNPDDALGIRLIQQNRFVEGIAALERAYEYDPKNFGLWYWMGLGYYYLGKYDQSIKFLNQHIGYWSTNEEQVVAMAHIGAAQQEQHKYDDAIRTLQQAYNANGGRDAGMEQFINANLALSHYHKKQYATSIPYFEKCLPQYPNLQGAWQHAKTMAR